MLTFSCWGAKYGETVWRIFPSWFGTYCIYICFFFIWCKYQEALCKFSLACFFLFFFCVAAVVTQVNTANNIQYLWLFLDIQIKYTWKSIIVSENTVLYTRPILHFSIDKHIFFMATTTRNIGLFFRFVGS